MFQTPIITVLSVAALDIGHRIGLDCQIPVGAAVLTVRVQEPAPHFSLNSCVLQPSDAANSLLIWLDQHLTTDETTITGYRLSEAASLFSRLRGTAWSPSLHALAGEGPQCVIDLSARAGEDRLNFQQACGHARIICAQTDPDRRFAAWIHSKVDDIEQSVQLDVLATFRLVLSRLAALNGLGQSVATAMGKHFSEWLQQEDCAAAQAHSADMLSAAD